MRKIVGLLVVALMSTFMVSSPALGVAGFGDVRGSEFWAAPVQWMVDNEITTGVTAGCFQPADAVTRGQAAAFMWRMQGEPTPSSAHPFSDVLAPWQQAAVAWMVEEGVTTGTSASSFSPDAVVTRAQLAVLLHRLAEKPVAPAHSFNDVTAGWQQAAIAWMVDEGITTGINASTFDPGAAVTRGQLATFFYRYQGSPAITVSDDETPCDGIGGGGTTPTSAPDGATTTSPSTTWPTPSTTVSPPADCTVQANQPISDVWFDIHYNSGPSVCARPDFVATGQTRYVDRSHPSASDSNSGSASQPWRTIVHAAEEANRGDVVYVRAGTYNDGRIEPRTSGVVFSAYPGEEHDVVIRGWGLRAIGASDLIVHGFAFEDIQNNGIQVIGPDVDNVVVANNTTYKTDYAGVSVRGVTSNVDPSGFDGVQDMLVIGNRIRRASLVNSEILSIGSGVVNIDIVANELWDSIDNGSGGNEGIAMKEGVRDSRIFGNAVHDLVDRGIHIDGGSAAWDALITNIEIFNNVLYDNDGQGMWVTTEGMGDVDGIYIHDNIAYGNNADGFLVYDHPHGNEEGGTVKNVVFEHNIAFDNGNHSGRGGFHVDHPTATGIVFRDNIAWSNEGFGLRVEPATVVDNNLCDDSICEIRSNPRFVNAPGNFALQSGSPAIGAATDGGNLGVR